MPEHVFLDIYCHSNITTVTNHTLQISKLNYTFFSPRLGTDGFTQWLKQNLADAKLHSDLNTQLQTQHSPVWVCRLKGRGGRSCRRGTGQGGRSYGGGTDGRENNHLLSVYVSYTSAVFRTVGGLAGAKRCIDVTGQMEGATKKKKTRGIYAMGNEWGIQREEHRHIDDRGQRTQMASSIEDNTAR